MGADSGENKSPEGEQGEAKPAPATPAVPALEPVDPSSVEGKRPAWADMPNKVKTLMKGNPSAPLFQWHLKKGNVVDDQGVQPQFLAEFLEAFRKVFEPLQVVPTGYIPEGNYLPRSNAASTRVTAVEQTGSVTISFSLGPEELAIGEHRGEALSGLQTVKATGLLGALLSLDADESLLSAVQPYGKRIGRSYGQLAELLADHKVEADWWSDAYSLEPIEVSAAEADTIADELVRKQIPDVQTYTIKGVIWDAATGGDKHRYIRISGSGRQIKASYDIPLITQVTTANSHEVEVEIREIAYRYPFAAKPHRREWELIKFLEVGEAAGALAEWEQLQIEGTKSPSDT